MVENAVFLWIWDWTSVGTSQMNLINLMHMCTLCFCLNVYQEKCVKIAQYAMDRKRWLSLLKMHFYKDKKDNYEYVYNVFQWLLSVVGDFKYNMSQNCKLQNCIVCVYFCQCMVVVYLKKAVILQLYYVCHFVIFTFIYYTENARLYNNYYTSLRCALLHFYLRSLRLLC